MPDPGRLRPGLRALPPARPAPGDGSAVAVLLFGLSPIAQYFHRMVSLDNIETVWVLAALVAATSTRARLGARAAHRGLHGVRGAVQGDRAHLPAGDRLGALAAQLGPSGRPRPTAAAARLADDDRTLRTPRPRTRPAGWRRRRLGPGGRGAGARAAARVLEGAAGDPRPAARRRRPPRGRGGPAAPTRRCGCPTSPVSGRPGAERRQRAPRAAGRPRRAPARAAGARTVVRTAPAPRRPGAGAAAGVRPRARA